MIQKISSFEEISAACAGRKAVAYFWASWAPMCSQTEQIFNRLSEQCPSLVFLSVDADAAELLTEKFGVSSVPAFVFLEGASKVDILIGANAPEISAKVIQFEKSVAPSPQRGCGSGQCGGGGCGSGGCAQKPAAAAPASNITPLVSKIEALLKREPVMLFMKGVPGAEKCGFSRQMVALLQENGVNFGHFDILTDEEVRQGMKDYSKWPTYPQLYSKGKLIGGLDVAKELVENGEFKEALGMQESLNDRLEKLINQEPIMLFMKGSPSAERCGFSRQIVELLKSQGVEKFGHFDILSDEEIRQGLKTYSKWPTYPQLYSKGKLIGGLDIVKELIENGELKETLGI